MRLFSFQFIVTLLIGFSFADEKQASEWVDLLANDSLDQWASAKGEVGNLWTITDGVLSLDKQKEGRGGFITTKKNYFDFELQFEFKISHAGNSGVKYRTKEGLGFEYQILDDDHSKDNKNPTHRTACLYELAKVPENRKLHSPASGKWNKGRIVAQGNKIEHWLNKQKVVSIEIGTKDWDNRFENSKYKKHPDFAAQPGPILLQDHGDDVSYRKVKIREITKQKKSKTKPVAHVEPQAYTVNCKACHLIDKEIVGPSLAELSDLYPTKKLPDFIKWCIEPGKKRPLMAQMPSMAHIPEEQLTEIFHYIKKATVGVRKVSSSGKDPFALAPATTQRPRVIRTFVPHAGPASIVIALPTEQKHNVIWDTDECRLRYISVGTFDNWPYLRSNGNALAEVGEIIHTENSPLFESSDLKYTGYQLTDEGLPVFHYSVNGIPVEEHFSLSGDAVQRIIKMNSAITPLNLPNVESDKLTVKTAVQGNTITINYTTR